RRNMPVRRMLAVAAVVLAAAGGTFFTVHRGGDPAVVSDVVALAAHRGPVPSVRMYDGDRVEFSMREMHGAPVVMATSEEPFPMPGNATPLGRTHAEPWMAHRGDISLVGLAGPHHMLLAGRMPPSDLLAFARSLGFAP